MSEPKQEYGWIRFADRKPQNSDWSETQWIEVTDADERIFLRSPVNVNHCWTHWRIVPIPPLPVVKSDAERAFTECCKRRVNEDMDDWDYFLDGWNARGAAGKEAK